jgi:hypothetical protein
VPTSPKPDKDDIALALGRAVIAWNMAENAVRGLLASLAAGRPHESIAARILTSDVGADGIVNGLKTFAQLTLIADAADAVVHVAGCYERLNSYRNYYISGISEVQSLIDQPAALGVITSHIAKGKLREHRELIGADKLDTFRQQSAELAAYSKQVRKHLGLHPATTRGDRPDLPKKPAKPDVLVRPHDDAKQHAPSPFTWRRLLFRMPS